MTKVNLTLALGSVKEKYILLCMLINLYIDNTFVVHCWTIPAS